MRNNNAMLNSIPDKNFDKVEFEEEQDDEIISNSNKNNKLINNEPLPIEWYIDSLIIYLGKIDYKHKNYNFQLLFDSITQDVNNSLNKINFIQIF